MTQQEPSPALPSDFSSVSSPSPVPSTSPIPPPSASFYKSLYRWAPTALLNETSIFTSLESITAYRKKQTCHKSPVFGKDHDKFVRMVAWWVFRLRRPFLFHLLHCFSEAWASLTFHPLRASTPNRGERRPCPTAPQQLGVCEGLCDPLPLPWPYAIDGCISLFLWSEEPRQEAVGQF